MNLWKHSSPVRLADLDKVKLPALSCDVEGRLTGAISYDEVKATVFAMAKGKAPGPDGFHVEFYQKCWDIIGDSLVAALKGFQISGILPGSDLSLFYPSRRTPRRRCVTFALSRFVMLIIAFLLRF